jgi:hypothetical protein
VDPALGGLARELAAPMPRRKALVLAGSALVMAAFPSLRPAGAVAAVSSCGALGCSGKCCSATDWSVPGLQGVCCDETDVCCSGARRASDPDHTYGWCCPQGQACGEELGDCKASCKAPSFECGQHCCNEHAACCPVSSEDDPICCPDDHDCVKQIQPGQAGITPDSRYVCCPPERLVTALTVSRICCPEGSVRQPSGGLSTGGGLCCTERNVCGQTCCDSLPSFPQRCVEGRRCEYEMLLMDADKVTATRDGAVKVPLTFVQPARGTLSVQLPGSAARASAADATSTAAAAARTPVVLGKAALLRGKRGPRDVRVRLSRRGRSELRKHNRLKVEIVLTLTDGKDKARTVTPVTLRRR